MVDSNANCIMQIATHLLVKLNLEEIWAFSERLKGNAKTGVHPRRLTNAENGVAVVDAKA